jgi:hypothetical protein
LGKALAALIAQGETKNLADLFSSTLRLWEFFFQKSEPSV